MIMERMKMETMENATKLKDFLNQAFPMCIKEGLDENGKIISGIDFQALSTLLGSEIICDEKCEFTWVGKKNAIIEANRPIRKALRPEISKSVDWDNTENVYIEGDNLEALKLLQESYLNSIKVIYIDPPYNTGNDFIYSDDYSISRDEFATELAQKDENGLTMFKNTDTNGRFHSDWCSMMFSRLLLARNLLSANGAIFISIDDNEQENMKKICDEVFGESNFVNCFIWNCSTAGGIRPKYASKTHEYIFCYAKDINSLDTFYAPLSSDAIKMYNQKDEKGLYRDKDFVFKNKSTNENQKYVITCPDGEQVKPKNGYIYRFIRESFEEALANNLVTFKKTSTGPLVTIDGKQAGWNIYIKKYLGDATGAPSTLIPKEHASIYNVGTQCVQDLFDGIRVFENVKPVNVIQYFINMLVKEGDIVMDFFSGSATTAHAVMQTEIDKNIKIKYIMVQIPDNCDESSDAYKAGYSTICEIGEERIRRATKKMISDNNMPFDSGFRVFRVDEGNMNEVYYAAGDYTQDLLKMMESNIKPDRTDLDLLFGCVLDWGLPLSLPYTSEEKEGCTIHTYNDGDLIACFNENIPEDVIKEIAKRKPIRVVFRDDCFKDSPSKINIEEIFKMLSPDTRIKVI